MKTLITIAGTLLAGATPFAASAALNHEAATTAGVQEIVAVWPEPTRPAQLTEADELEELRRAIAELRAEKDRLRAELAVERAEAATPSGDLHQEALNGWIEAYQDGQTATPEAQWPERVAESANAAVQEALRKQREAARQHERSAELHEAYRQLAEGEYRRAVELQRALAAEQAEQAEQAERGGLFLDVEPHEHEDGITLEVRARLAEVQAEKGQLELELHEAQEHLGGLWVHDDGESGAGVRWNIEPQHDESGVRWHVVTERDDEEGAAEAESRYGRRARVVVVEDGENEDHALQVEALERLIEDNTSEVLDDVAIEVLIQQLERQHEEASSPQTRHRVRHLVLDSEGNEIEAGEGLHVVLVAPDGTHSRTFIHDSDGDEHEARVYKTRKLLVRGEDGELIELHADREAPAAPRAPRAVRAPRAPIGIGSGPAPADDSARREAVRWNTSEHLPRGASGRAAATDRDELLREVHVLTKDMLSELRLLRAAVDELRRDVDANLPAHSGARSRGR
jgi:hypothetical protein